MQELKYMITEENVTGYGEANGGGSSGYGFGGGNPVESGSRTAQLAVGLAVGADGAGCGWVILDKNLWSGA